jgi:hypothetical protein
MEWILVFFMSGHQRGGPAVIQRIPTPEECQRVLVTLQKHRHFEAGECIPLHTLPPKRATKGQT